MRPPSALAPTFVPYRPGRPGWVAYHDVGPTVGISGLAMTWRSVDGMLRYVAALDFERDGHVLANGSLSEQQDLTEVLSRSYLRGKPPNGFEWNLLSLLLPSPGNGGAGPTSNGLPSVEEHAELARRAVAQATLPPAMRTAFEACLDRGAPTRVSLQDLRRKHRSPAWPALAMAVSDPALARMVLAHAPLLMAAPDPLAEVRRCWPGLTDAHLRRLRDPEGVRLADQAGARRAGQCLDLLAACPVDWWPRSDSSTAFLDCAGALKVIRSSCPGHLSMSSLAAASKGDWNAFADRLLRAAGLAKTGRLLDRASDCRDPVLALTKEVVLPLLASCGNEESVARLSDFDANRDRGTLAGTAFKAAGGLLYGGKSAAAILETSREWHARRDSIDAEIRGDAGAASWPPLFDGEFRDGDVAVVCIGDYASLREEGADGPDRDGVGGLDHCVASRLSECLSGRAHILSVRLHGSGGSWGRLSTCQVSARPAVDGGVRIEIDEHRGRENAEADERSVAAVVRLSEALESGGLAVSPDALSTDRDDQTGLRRLCGYDWRDPDAVATAVGSWRLFLPRWARDLDPDELHRTLVEREILPGSDVPMSSPAP